MSFMPLTSFLEIEESKHITMKEMKKSLEDKKGRIELQFSHSCAIPFIYLHSPGLSTHGPQQHESLSQLSSPFSSTFHIIPPSSQHPSNSQIQTTISIHFQKRGKSYSSNKHHKKNTHYC
jgi:hypothetical protein